MIPCMIIKYEFFLYEKISDGTLFKVSSSDYYSALRKYNKSTKLIFDVAFADLIVLLKLLEYLAGI